MWINLILKTIYAFNGRINFYTCFFWIFWENLFKLLCCNWSTTASTSTLFRLCAINIRLAGFCLWRWDMPLDREKNFLPFKYVLLGGLWGLSISINYISIGQLTTIEKPWNNGFNSTDRTLHRHWYGKHLWRFSYPLQFAHRLYHP